MTRVLCLAAALVVGMGCDSHGDEHHGETPYQELCEAIDDTSMPVVATAEANEEATAELHVAAHPHTVTLEANTTGYVWFHLDKAGDTAIVVRSEGTVAGFLHEESEEPIGPATAHTDCPSTLDTVYDVEGMEAGHWHIKLTAADKETTFEIMVISDGGSHESHDGHDH